MSTRRGEKPQGRARQNRPPTKPPRTRLEVDERRAQLLARGLECFSARAYDEVSIDEVAQAAGISKGLLYHYFPTKRDFYAASLREAARQLIEQTITDQTAPPLVRLARGLDAYLSFVEQRGRAYTALMRGGVGSDPEIAAILEETRALFAEHLLEGIPVERPGPLLRMACRGWIGFVEAMSLDWLERRDVDRSHLVSLLCGLVPEVVRLAQGEAESSKQAAE